MNTYNYKFTELNFSHKLNEPVTVDDEYPDHFHFGYEMLYFLDGDIDYVIENQRYRLQPEDLLFIKPGEHHFFNILSERRYERMVVKFTEHWIPGALSARLRQRGSHYSIGGTELAQLFRRIDAHAADFSGEAMHILMRSCLDELLVKFSYIDMDELPSERVNETVGKVIDYINTHLSEPLAIDELCRLFGFSRSYISKVFIESLHEPPKQYIINKKIMYAKALISKGEKPTNVSELCGFTDYSTFYRAYKKIVGVPPSGQRRGL